MVKRKADIKLITHSKKFKLELENLSVASFVEVKEADLEIELNEATVVIVKNDNSFEILSKKEVENITISMAARRRYQLRARKPVKTVIKNKPATKIQAKKTEMKVLKSERKITVNGEVFHVGEVVLAKCKGWCHWPAIITSISGVVVMAINVEYFGTNQKGKINYKNKEKTLIKFDQGQEIIEENENKYRGAFAGALNAARIAIDAAKVDATHNPA